MSRVRHIFFNVMSQVGISTIQTRLITLKNVTDSTDDDSFEAESNQIYDWTHESSTTLLRGRLIFSNSNSDSESCLQKSNPTLTPTLAPTPANISYLIEGEHF